MKTEEILFILTFVFGNIHTACMCFGVKMQTITEILFTEELIKECKEGKAWYHGLILIMSIPINAYGKVFTYFSLCYQIWFWFIHIFNIVK